MKKKILILVLFVSNLLAIAQDRNPIYKGFITLENNDRIEFVNLSYDRKLVIFTNVATKREMSYFANSIKKIEKYVDPKPIVPKEVVKEIKKDTLFKPNYPDGIYKTKEDFINKKPSEVVSLVQKGLYGFEKPILANIAHNCYFYTNTTDSKIKNVFAVSYKGYLYFQINGILSNRNKTDRAQTNNAPNGFVRVIMGGENYFYTEADLTNQWAQGLAYGGVGGVAGVIIANSIVYGKGVVWDFKKQEFNIFKNCEDYNDFAKEIYPEGIQDCPNQQPDVLKIRKVLFKIK